MKGHNLMKANFAVCLCSIIKTNFSMPFSLYFLQKKYFFAFGLLFIFLEINAQYTEVINSNKPGFSESPYSVGTGVYQLESTIFYRKKSIEPIFSRPESLGLDLSFRTSFFLEQLEFNAQLAYQKDEIAFSNVFTSSYSESGLSELNVAAKYLLYEQKFTDKSKEIRSWKKRMAFDYKRLIPSVAIYAGLNTNFVSDIYKKDMLSPKAGILLQNDLSEAFNIITNVYYDYITTNSPEISYILTATYNFSNRWSTFFENQSIFKEFQTDVNFGTGLAYLFSKDIQINASGRLLLEGKTTGFFGGIGVSYRLDRHRDSFKDTNPKPKLD